jgi:alpha-galactosidase
MFKYIHASNYTIKQLIHITMTKISALLVFFLLSIFSVFAQDSRKVFLDDLTIQSFSEGIPGVTAKTCAGGDSIKMMGKVYQRGVGVHSTSVLTFQLNGKGLRFSALTGVDDNATPGMVYKMYAIADEKILFESNPMKVGDAPQLVNVDLKNVQRFGLLVMVKEERGSKTYSNWANAVITMQDTSLPQTVPNDPNRYILTPAPLQTPRLTTPNVYGATPGNPFLFTVTATGNRPMTFKANALPRGLSLDAKTGIIKGKVAQRGNYKVTLMATNALGSNVKLLNIKIGDTISLTPPIGWNGWNSWARNIDQDKVLSSAKAMVSKGLSNHGWNYINIDDAWQGYRGGKYNAIQPNNKFPSFIPMIEFIHSLGLKVGVYSTPWITSYAGYVGGSSNFENGAYPDSVKNNKRSFRYIGKYRFEENDAKQMADWGIDFLKYDWRIEVPSTERMGTALKKSGRDIIYSISNSAPFSNVTDWVKLTNMYRTGPDIRDSWLGLYTCAFTLDNWGPYGGPGHWNDPDMMILGNVSTGTDIHPTRLTPDEQYSHVSLFSLLAAPLMIGCPIEQLDDFTVNLLSNDEVIEIDQDPLGKSGRLIADENGVQIWAKPLEDGSLAVGLFNTANFEKTPQSYFHWGTEKENKFTLAFAKLGLKGNWRVRDVWRQKDLGVFANQFSTSIRHHGVVMVRLFPSTKK